MPGLFKKTAFGVGVAALLGAAALVPESASAATPECQQPSEYKCLAIDNYMYASESGAIEAINSIKVRKRETTSTGGGSNPFVTECYNVSPGGRVYIHQSSEFLINLSPGDEIFVQEWTGRDCDSGNGIADNAHDGLVVPSDDLRYFWIELRW